MTTPSATPILNVGVIGLGHLHPRSYMPLFASVPNLRVTAVAEENKDLREPFCKEFKVRGYATAEEMLGAEDLGVAALFLPHADAPAVAEACATRKLHLMVEKPMAASSAGAQRIVDAARGAGVQVTTGYVWRFHPVAREIRDLIRQGHIGDVVAAEGRCAAGKLHRYIQGHSPWILQKARSGGGPMYNLGVHWIDLFRWILDDEIEEVSGRNVKLNTQFDVEDNSFAHMRFSKGAIAALDISYTVPDAFPHGRDLYVSIRGTQGVLSWSPAYEGQKDTLFICSDHPAMGGSPRVTRQYELDPVAGYSGYMGLRYVQQFAQCLAGAGTPLVSGEDGVAVLRVVEAIYASDEQRRWVTVPGPEGSSQKEKAENR